MKLAILLILILAARAESPARYEPTKSPVMHPPWNRKEMFANRHRCSFCWWHWAMREWAAEMKMRNLRREFE